MAADTPNRLMSMTALALAAALLAGCVHAPCGPAAKFTEKEAVIDPASCARPKMPKAELAARHLGTVKFSFLVGDDGQVLDSIILQSTGYPALDDTARAALIKCRFAPATLNGKPIIAWTELSYQWGMH